MTVPPRACGERGYERFARVPGCGRIGLPMARSAHKPYPASYTTTWGANRHLHVEHLPAGVMDHEEHVECPKEDRFDAEKITRPEGRCVLLQE